MWDVNTIFCSIGGRFAKCIALTMWDVNGIRLRVVDLHFQYCLNYVGCKFFTLILHTLMCLRIALTMWDVNEYISEAAVAASAGIALTMWDVNTRL